MATYAIPEMNMERLEKKLTRIRNKAAKYGCEFRYERVGEHFEMVETGEYDEETGEPIKEPVRYIDIDVEGKAEVNGWQFAATLTYTAEGNLITGVSGLEIPERYYSCTPWCEHCKTHRDRKSSYIVYHAESGEFKQVGHGCLRDFTGGMSAEAVAHFESWIKEVEEASEFSGMGGWGCTYFDVEQFMVAAAEVIRIYGYAKRYNEHDERIVCTADRTENLYRAAFGMRMGAARDSIMEQYYEALDKGFDLKRPESIELAKTVREWIANSERNDNYFHNLKVACANTHAAGKMLGLLVSAFPAYNRELEIEAERRDREAQEKKAAAASAWIGEVGDKVNFKLAGVRTITSWETQYGTTRVYKLIDEAGHECTWKTSNWVDDRDIGKTIKGTVKELKEYRGIKQTELTRCRIA